MMLLCLDCLTETFFRFEVSQVHGVVRRPDLRGRLSWQSLRGSSLRGYASRWSSPRSPREAHAHEAFSYAAVWTSWTLWSFSQFTKKSDSTAVQQLEPSHSDSPNSNCSSNIGDRKYSVQAVFRSDLTILTEKSSVRSPSSDSPDIKKT